MAIINNANITNQIANLANSGVIDTNELLNIINGGLNPTERIIPPPLPYSVSVGIYKNFTDSDMIKAKPEIVTTGMWAGDSGTITSFYTSSVQIAASSSKYYTNVYSSEDLSTGVEFALAYGHVTASGSVTYDIDQNTTFPTKAIYAQYRSMLLNPTDTRFSFVNSTGTTTDSNDIYVINLSRNRFRQSIDPGNWQLTLSGSNGTYKFIDNSGKTVDDSSGLTGRVFQVVSGSLNIGSTSPTVSTATASNGQGFGLFYPDRGIIILNPSALGVTIGNVTFSTGSNGTLQSGSLSGSLSQEMDTYNHARLFSAIKLGADFDCRRTETISTQHYFVRVTNKEFNYSNNPTFVNATGSFVQKTFESDPYTFITTMGLYNASNELVAVAKTSQPIPKSFDREALIKVKLSY